MEFDKIFIDSSAFIALYLQDELFHLKAVDFWKKAREKKLHFFTNNFIFDETLTWLVKRKGKAIAVGFGNYLLQNNDIVPVKSILPEDEKMAWKLFCKLPGRLSFTDCTSFSMMKRLKIRRVFTFDKHFKKAGFKIVL